MTVSSTDYATCQTALRRCLANGTQLDGYEKRLLLDVIQHGASNERDSAATSLEALLVTHFGILVADGASPTQTHVNNMVTACATARTAAIAGAVITDLTADDSLDGRET